jgi:glycosyltransferase involved in cell wall biosynthesis
MDAVSVVIPTYNRAPLIGRALESVLSQSRAGDEVIVIDDGSTDDTEAKLAPWRDRVVYRKVPNGGAGRARNAGLALARRPLIAFLDSDDEWLPGKLEVQRRFLDARPDILFCFTDMRALYASGAVKHKLTRQYAGGDFTADFLGPPAPYSQTAAVPEGVADFETFVGDLYPAQLDHEYVQIGTLMLRRSALEGGALRFPEDIRVSEDAEFVASLARRGTAAYLDWEGEVFHHHGGERLTDLDSFTFVDARLRLLARVWGQDREFLDKHAEKYRAAFDRLHLLRTRILLSVGRRAQAREQLKNVGRPPLVYRAACMVPASVLKFAAFLRSRRR